MTTRRPGLKLIRFAAVVPLVLTLGGLRVTAASLTPVDVACNGAQALSADVDAPTLTSLQASIEGIALNPSGTTCASTSSSATSSGNGSGAFVVGGGRYVLTPSACTVNFALSGHIDDKGPNGTQTVTEANSPQNLACGGQGHLKADVTCIAVSGNEAEVRGDILEQSGSLGPDFFPPGYTVWVTDVQDNGTPSTGVPDTIVQYADQAGTENDCQAPSGSQLFTVQNGNVTVHQ